MVFNNLVIKKGNVNKQTAETFAKILSPFAPHLGEELWSLYGNNESLAYEQWPEADEILLKVDSFEYPVSFNGKVRFKIELPADIPKEEAEKEVLNHQKAQKWLDGKSLRKFIFIPKKIINVVIG